MPEPHRRVPIRGPRICLRDHVVHLATAALLVVVVLVWGVRGGVLHETVAVGAVLGGLLAIYYTVMLYGGFRYDSGRHRWTWNGMQWKDLGELPSVDLPWGGFDAGDDLFGAVIAGLLAILAAIVSTLVLVVLAWAGLNLLGYAVYLLWLPTYVVLRYGVRLALVNRRRVQGDFLRAAGVAMLHGAGGGVVLGGCFGLIDALIRFWW